MRLQFYTAATGLMKLLSMVLSAYLNHYTLSSNCLIFGLSLKLALCELNEHTKYTSTFPHFQHKIAVYAASEEGLMMLAKKATPHSAQA